MKKEIFENMNTINELKENNKILNEQIATQGIESANNLLYSLNSRLRIYNPILKKLQTGINIGLSTYHACYDGASQVRITYSYNQETWQILFNNYKIELNKGINTSTFYKIFCVDNPILVELNFDEICEKIENYIITVQKDKILKLTKENNNKEQSLKSFKDFVDNNMMITLNQLFKLKNDFKNTGDLDLIEIILETIDNLENYIAENLD